MATSNDFGPQRMRSGSTSSDHTYCYIMDNPSDYTDLTNSAIKQGFSPTQQKKKLNKSIKWTIVGGVATTLLAAVVVVLVIVVPKKEAQPPYVTTTQLAESTLTSLLYPTMLTTLIPNTPTTPTPTHAGTSTERRSSSSTKSKSSSSTTTSKTTTTTKTKPLPVIHCACAVDLHNLNNDTLLLKKEKYLIVDIVEKILNNVGNSTAGLWVYGFVKYTAAKVFSKVFDEMLDDLGGFYQDATNKMVFGPELSPRDQNLTDAINNGADPLRVANYLLLLSGMKTVSESWRIEPRYAYKRIVIVSLQGANFTNHVDSRGIAVNVPFDYTPSDVETVFQAIASGFT